MKFTFDWLGDHLRTDLSHNEIADRLVGLGIEVESVVDSSLDGFVVGRIVEAERHPNADRLQVCKVDVGSEVLDIVCGAKNARSGIYVVVALVGSIIPSSGDVLRKSSIRGVESNGMMCSASELALNDHDSEGILELPAEGAVVGANPSELLGLGEVVFDVSLTANRADCFSVRGIARDLAASGAGELLPLRDVEIKSSTDNDVEVRLETDGCNYFSILAVRDVAGETPEYIKRRLKAVGQKIIHMPVDIANYVCLDIGQPLHIFDLDKVQDRIVVRAADAGMTIHTLNGKETTLRGGETIVASKDGSPLSIAGIIGGTESSFDSGSHGVLIEGAYFDKVAIATAGQSLNIQTDSRTRFERGVDPQMVDYAVRYVASLIGSVCSCRISNVKKYGKLPENKNTVSLSSSKFSIITRLSVADFERSPEILKNLGMTVISESKDEIVVQTPSWRHDLAIEEDLIEEVLRMIGYENVADEELERCEPIAEPDVVDSISDALVFRGYYEVKTFSLINKEIAKMFAEPDEIIAVRNPLTVDFAVLRPSIVASHLRLIKLAQNRSQRNNKIFEVGRKYVKKGTELTESQTICVTLAGDKSDRTWRHATEDVSVFDLKNDLENILMSVARVKDVVMRPGGPAYYHPGRSAVYTSHDGKVIAYLGEVHPVVLSEMDIKGPVVCLELFNGSLPDAGRKIKRSCPIFSQYQPTSRDFSFVIDKSASVGDIVSSIKALKLDEVKSVRVFDVYESTEIGDQSKAVAFEVTLQSDKSTLSDSDISSISSSIIEVVAKKHGGVLR